MEKSYLPGLFRLVLGALAAVLVGNRPPAPDGHRHLGLSTVLLGRVRQQRLHSARVSPVVAKIEDVLKLVTRPQERSHLDLIGDELVGGRILVSQSYDFAGRKTEPVEVGVVPSCESNIDRLRELAEGVAGRDKENAPGRGLELLSHAGEKFDRDAKPSPSHYRDSIAIETYKEEEEVFHVKT